MSAEQFIWASALSGTSATAGLLSYLAVAPRAKADPDALAKMRSLTSHSGIVEIPTVVFTGVADPVTVAGNQQAVVDKYAEYYAEKWAEAKANKRVTGEYKKPANNLLVLWTSHQRSTPSSLPLVHQIHLCQLQPELITVTSHQSSI